MFTKRDFVIYFSDIEQFEQNMRDLYAEALERINDREVKRIFEELSAAEERHREIADGLRRLAIKSSL